MNKSEYNLKYRELNGDQIRKSERDKYANNPEKYCKRVKEYREANIEKIREQDRMRYPKRRDKALAYQREYRKLYPEKAKAIQLRNKYGITLEEYNRLLLLQDGVCAVCKCGPTNKRQLSVDHHHGTGKIRALLCSGCNSAIGCAKENPGTLRLLANYLEER